MPDSIATAFVSIKPDLDGFRDELKAGLDSETDVTKSVKVDANTGEARVEIDELEARIDELSSRSATVKIGTKSSARSEITDIQDALLSLRNETLVPNVDPGRLEQINGELDGLDQRLRNVDTDATRASHSLSDGGGGGGGGGGGLIAAALAATPALATLGATGAGALTAVGVAGAAAITGLGAFMLAIDGTSSSAKQLKAQFSEVVTTWQATQQAFTNPVIQDAIGILPTLLHSLTPEVAATSQALIGVENSVAGSLGSPYWRMFSTYIAGEGGQAITSFSGLLGGLGHSLAGVAEGFAPEIARIDGDMQRWGATLDRLGNQASSGGLNSLMSYLQTNGPLAAHTVETLGSDFLTLAGAAGRVGPSYLTVLNTAGELLGVLERLNPEVTSWALGIGGAAYGANRLLGPLGGLTGVFSTLKGFGTDVGNFAGIANGAEKAVGPVGALATGLGAMARAGTTAAEGEEEAAIGMGALLGPLGVGVAIVGGVVAGVILLGDHLGDMAKQAQAAGQSWTQNMVQAAEQSGASIPQVISLLEQQAAAVQASIAAHHGSAQELLDEGTKYADLKREIGNLQSQQAAQTSTQEAVNTATGEAAGYTGNLAQQYGALSQQLTTANQTLSQTESLLNSMLGIELSVAQSTTGFYQSVDNLTSSLHTNGSALDGSSTKALANQQAFEGVGSSIESVIGSMEKQGSTSDQIVGKVQSLTGYIEAQAGKYGLTKGQVDDYLHSLGLTPAQVKTDLQLSGYDAAVAKTSDIRSRLDALQNRHIVTYLDVVTTSTLGTGSAAGGMGRFAAGTNSAPGGPAWVGDGGGPETLITPGGRPRIVGAGGPEVIDVPAGSRILTAQQTRGLPRYADGLNVDIDPVVRTVEVTHAPTIVVQGDATEQTVRLITAALAADRVELMDTIAQLIPA